MIPHQVIHDLVAWQLPVSPERVLTYETLDDYCKNMIQTYDSEEYGNNSLTYGGPPFKLGSDRATEDRSQYSVIREEIRKRLTNAKMNISAFLEGYEDTHKKVK
jgi:hypothetical protein